MARYSYVVFFVMSFILLLGCAGESSVKGSKPAAPKEYSGFMDMQAGMWAETVTKSGGQKTTVRTELLEYSPTLAKFQIVADIGGVKTVSQVWTDPSAGKSLRYITSVDGEVTCMSAESVPSGYVPSEGDSYPPKPDVSKGSYTTPGGRTVSVAKFSTSSGEVWVSSEVPFGVVKVMSGGQTLSSLYDFGKIGARSLISDDDISDCTDLSGYASASTVTYSSEEADAGDDEYDYEEYYETGDSYEAQAYEPSGSSASMDCSACYQMPQAAKNACLAACS